MAAARDRLARMVGADRDGFSARRRNQFAQAAEECLIERLCQAAERACAATIGRPAAAVISGSGSFLARRLARRLIGPGGPIISLKEAWGAVASSAGCAHALLTLAAERFRGDSGCAWRSEAGRLRGGPIRMTDRHWPSSRSAAACSTGRELPASADGLPRARRANDPGEQTVLIAGGGPAADWIRSARSDSPSRRRSRPQTGRARPRPDRRPSWRRLLPGSIVWSIGSRCLRPPAESRAIPILAAATGAD